MYEHVTIAERIVRVAKKLTEESFLPLTRKAIIKQLPSLNPDSINPMIQAMTVNAPGGPSISPKYWKKVFKRVGWGEYELLEEWQ